MKFKTSFIAAVPLFLGIISGCVSGTYVPPNSDSQSMQLNTFVPSQRYVVTEPLAPQWSRTTTGKFNSQMIFLVDQLQRNIDRNNLSNTFIVTSFTNLDKISETSSLGRLAAENVIHELQVRGWRVFEVRLSKDVVINGNGEFSLSRDISKLKEMYKIGGIVTGTYSVADGNLVVNARVIDINTGVIISSSQVFLPANWYTNLLLDRKEDRHSIKIIGDKQ